MYIAEVNQRLVNVFNSLLALYVKTKSDVIQEQPLVWGINRMASCAPSPLLIDSMGLQ